MTHDIFSPFFKGRMDMHLIKDKRKLLLRIRRIQGQVLAIERLLQEDHQECANVLQVIAGCRGAINGLMNQVIEGHIRTHLLESRKKPTPDQAEAAEELIQVINTYLK